MTVKSITKQVRPILLSHGVSSASLFGSAARNELKPSSDVDLLIKTDGKMGLFGLVGLKLELEKALHRKIDLVEDGMLKRSMVESVMKERIVIL